LINENTITICSGRAGTGKTFIACAQALKLLKTEKYKKILLVKSVTELEGESVGFLKGTLEEKMFPHTLSFLDNFYKIIGEENTKKMVEMGFIEVLPLAYIRGRSIDDSIIIVDEAQNITLGNMRSTLTRVGENSKMIITGDSKQVDLKNKKQSSLDIVVNIFSDKEGVGTMYFTTADIVRSSIVRMIEDEFDVYEEKNTIKK
jgi:phosphate starvation-inducible PhoH-like protein